MIEYFISQQLSNASLLLQAIQATTALDIIDIGRLSLKLLEDGIEVERLGIDDANSRHGELEQSSAVIERGLGQRVYYLSLGNRRHLVLHAVLRSELQN